MIPLGPKDCENFCLFDLAPSASNNGEVLVLATGTGDPWRPQSDPAEESGKVPKDTKASLLQFPHN